LGEEAVENVVWVVPCREEQFSKFQQAHMAFEAISFLTHNFANSDAFEAW